MPAMPRQPEKNNGYALIVVLFSLTIIAILFAVASTRTLAKLQDSASERLLIETNQRNQDILDMAIAWKVLPENLNASGFTVQIAGHEYSIHLQDVGGLVDLNTASPELLQILFDAIGAEKDAIVRFREWRRGGKRLRRVSDLLPFAKLDTNHRIDLTEIATVYSGRRGIAFEVVPELLRGLVTQSAGSDAETNPLFLSEKSNVNFLVGISETTSGASHAIGTIHIGAARVGRVLE